ncbi:hypothetical protein IVA87_13085 [Bradyrhizobium sp. 147]|uniref:hypothetical protein n=1 Tax=Bradyrhizobium sp. 147 TaxID=2782623 RepID=UPI001FF73841|nr:hypothetical protein [Bradyrhizobium sp. 147]MCK1680339.1 hypothetical protein [Bradyrhizobium sp. 147]
MADTFDRWIEWANNPPGQRRGLPSDVHASVMSLDREDRTDREKVNAAVEHRAELRRTGRTAWIYLDDFDRGTQRTIGDPEWVKVFASAEAADRWFDKHDPEGVAWEYEIDGGPRQASVWIFLVDEGSRKIGDRAWIKLFASEETAEKWLEQNAPSGQSWEYPVED